MNGYPMSILLMIFQGLTSLIMVLSGIILRLHQKSDEEHRQRFDDEIKRLRDRLHQAESKLAGLEYIELGRMRNDKDRR